MVHSTPGYTAIKETEESQVWWAGRDGAHHVAVHKVTLDDENTDAGNTGRTSTLRGGHALALQRSSGNAYIYDADANDGRQVPVGVLENHVNLLDADGVAENKRIAMMVAGLLKDGEMLGDWDMHARNALSGQFMTDKPESFPMAPGIHGVTWAGYWAKTANYTLTTADHMQCFVANGSGALTFTLPTIAHGLCFGFLSIANQNMIIDGASNIISKGNASADKLTYSTASEKIGAACAVYASYVGGTTLKWVHWNLSDTTVTPS